MVAKQQGELNDQMQARREKMDALREAGIDPFGHRFDRTALAADVHAQYDDETKEDLLEAGHEVVIAGRMMSKRGKGKVALPIFATVAGVFRSMCARTESVKTTIKSLRRPTWETFSASPGMS